MMRVITRGLTVLALTVMPSVAAAQSGSWTPEISLSAGLGHVFRWDDETFGDRIAAGVGVAIVHGSDWAFEWHVDRTFGLEPKQAPCGLVNVTCIGIAHYGPTEMAVMSMSVRRYIGDGRVQPYVSGGLGVMWSRSLHSVTQVRGSTATNTEFASSDRGFGPDLGAGLRLRLARSWSGEMEARWLDAPWLSRQNLAVTRLLAGATYAIR